MFLPGRSLLYRELTATCIGKELFPTELHATLDGDDLPAGEMKRRRGDRKLHLSSITSLPTAEDVFTRNGGVIDDPDGAEGKLRTLQMVDQLVDEEGDEDMDDLDADADDGLEEDDAYDDEDAGDYDAEQYFDGGDEGEDYGGDDDGDGGGNYF
jgi:DNA-directed RNA polymerase III subunit RPC7